VEDKKATDIVVLDPKHFEDRATFEEPFNPSVGVQWLFLAGRAAIANGEPQKVLAGKPLRRKDAIK